MVDPPPSPCAPPHLGVAAQQSPSPKNHHMGEQVICCLKKSIVSEVKKLIEDHLYSICTACEKVEICHLLFLRWQKPLPTSFQDINKGKKKIHPGNEGLASGSTILRGHGELGSGCI